MQRQFSNWPLSIEKSNWKILSNSNPGISLYSLYLNNVWPVKDNGKGDNFIPEFFLYPVDFSGGLQNERIKARLWQRWSFCEEWCPDRLYRHPWSSPYPLPPAPHTVRNWSTSICIDANDVFPAITNKIQVLGISSGRLLVWRTWIFLMSPNTLNTGNRSKLTLFK